LKISSLTVDEGRREKRGVWVTRCLQAAVVGKLKEAVLNSIAKIMKVDIAVGAKRLVLLSNSTCCGHTELLTADDEQ